MVEIAEPAPTAGLLGSAAAHATTRVPIATPADRVGDVFAGLRGQVFDSADVIAVCSGRRLAGLLTIERLLAAAPGAVVSEVMDGDPPTVGPGTDQERAAWRAVQHGEPGLAVVDADGRFRGLIPPQRLLAVLLTEHDEDLARFGGFLASTRRARLASTEPVRRRLWHRLPWLLVGLAGAFIAAVVVGGFERQLAENVLIVFFVPGVVYLADAVGNQTVTLVVRGLSVGVGVAGVVARELVTGLTLGVVLAVLAFPVVSLAWQDSEVAAAVAIALFAASSVATVVAMALPWTISRFGKDPAFGAGPLATVVQDLVSIVIYFAVASLIVTG